MLNRPWSMTLRIIEINSGGADDLQRYQDILVGVAGYYASKLAQHGPTARGVDWNGEQSQRLRHRQFLRLFGDDRTASILDLGCGYGDFLQFLRQQNFTGQYIGYDIAPEMIAAARRLHGEGGDRRWQLGAIPSETADYAVASGIFNVKGHVPDERWSRYVTDTIDALARAARRGFAFNVLTSASDPARRRPDLYYADPAEMLGDCFLRFGRSVAMLQDYGLWEFTIVVRHRPDSQATP
jgi:SAM-dependent methyltransferase